MLASRLLRGADRWGCRVSRYLLNRPYKDPAMMQRRAAPCGGPVSPARADELRASWRATSEAWCNDPRRSDTELDVWVETFAPDHPEWDLPVPAAASSLSSGERTHE